VLDRTCWSLLEALGGGKEREDKRTREDKIIELEKRREGAGQRRRRQEQNRALVFD
jgi:hypothetical protein